MELHLNMFSYISVSAHISIFITYKCESDFRYAVGVIPFWLRNSLKRVSTNGTYL